MIPFRARARFRPAALAILAALIPCSSAGATQTSEVLPEWRRSHAWMVDALSTIAKATPRDNPWLGLGKVETMRDSLARLDDQSKPARRIRLMQRLASEELRLGNAETAVQLLERAGGLAERSPGAISSDQLVELQYLLGVCYLRWGEDLNCVCSTGSESCIVPFAPSALHRDARGSQGALRCFGRVLAQRPDHVKARWLLGLAARTLGIASRDLPAGQRLPQDLFDTEGLAPPFENLASVVGLDTLNLSGGVVLEDFDADGDLDVLTSTFDTQDGMHYLRNDEGTFVDATVGSGLEGLRGGLNMVQGDADNDGRVDVFVLRGAWLAMAGQHPNSLLKNLGGGRFIDVTKWAGLAEVHRPSQTAAWADYDNDGDLDLYVGNEHRPGRGFANQLFRNRGDGRFEDVAEGELLNLRFTKGVAWGDYDGDRRPDLYVSNLGEPNRLLHNEGEGKFTDVAEQLGVHEPIESFPLWFWDFDNDGNLDLYVSSYIPDLGPIAASALGFPSGVELARLYRGDGRGGFEDVAAARGLTRLHAPMGANFGDYDYDGYPDFYLGTGYTEFDALMPNVLYHNLRGQRFTDVTSSSRTGHLQKGHAVAFADLDGDGDQDLFAQLGGAFPGDGFHDAFFANPGTDNHRIEVELIGTRSNRSAIGARIRAVVQDGPDSLRSVYRWVGSGGSFGASPLRQEIGLGAETLVIRLEIDWPCTPGTQEFTELQADRRYVITEGDPVPELSVLRKSASR